MSRVYAEHLAEAGLFRLMTGQGNNGAVVSSCSVEGVNRIGKEYPVQHLYSFYVAGFHAKHHEILLFQCLRLYT